MRHSSHPPVSLGPLTSTLRDLEKRFLPRAARGAMPMPDLLRTLLLTLTILFGGATMLPAQQAVAPVTIRAAQVVNGRGGVQRNVVVTVRGSKIERVAPAAG